MQLIQAPVQEIKLNIQQEIYKKIPDSNILDNAIYKISCGDFNSLKPEYRKGLYKEETNNPTAVYFKDMMFPKFIRKREGFPTVYKTESLVFKDGRIESLYWTFADGSHQTINL
jgi:hypothetical protein